MQNIRTKQQSGNESIIILGNNKRTDCNCMRQATTERMQLTKSDQTHLFGSENQQNTIRHSINISRFTGAHQTLSSQTIFAVYAIKGSCVCNRNGGNSTRQGRGVIFAHIRIYSICMNVSSTKQKPARKSPVCGGHNSRLTTPGAANKR